MSARFDGFIDYLKGKQAAYLNDADIELVVDGVSALRERMATLESQSAEWERLANYARDNYTRRNAEALAEKARADAAEAATVEAIAEWIVKAYPGTFAGLEIRAGDWKKKT